MTIRRFSPPPAPLAQEPGPGTTSPAATPLKRSRRLAIIIYRRIKSGLPRIRAGRNVCGDSLTTSRVASVITPPKIASKYAALTGVFVVVQPRLLRASAVAKLIRRVVASGLNQASSVFLYPSGGRQP